MRRKVNKMDNELILVIDFGGQYNQLIAPRVRAVSYTHLTLPTTP